mmetsp:Transcript_64143/g.150531  ORF Transcript_64143/g.150531 Transcript_64143/m.150531 type:complete len:207 (+) Transcript_64143:125-745(+)
MHAEGSCTTPQTTDTFWTCENPWKLLWMPPKNSRRFRTRPKTRPPRTRRSPLLKIWQTRRRWHATELTRPCSLTWTRIACGQWESRLWESSGTRGSSSSQGLAETGSTGWRSSCFEVLPSAWSNLEKRDRCPKPQPRTSSAFREANGSLKAWVSCGFTRSSTYLRPHGSMTAARRSCVGSRGTWRSLQVTAWLAYTKLHQATCVTC